MLGECHRVTHFSGSCIANVVVSRGRCDLNKALSFSIQCPPSVRNHMLNHLKKTYASSSVQTKNIYNYEQCSNFINTHLHRVREKKRPLDITLTNLVSFVIFGTNHRDTSVY